MVNVVICEWDIAIQAGWSSRLRNMAHLNHFELLVTTVESNEMCLFEVLERAAEIDILCFGRTPDAASEKGLMSALIKEGFRGKTLRLPDSVRALCGWADSNNEDKEQIEGADVKEFLAQFVRSLAAASDAKASFLFCKKRAEARKIPIGAIRYIESTGRKATIYYDCELKFEYYAVMRLLLEKLEGHQFMRVHKSFVINLAHVESIRADLVQMDNGARVPVSRNYKNELKEAFAAVHGNQTGEDVGIQEPADLRRTVAQ